MAELVFLVMFTSAGAMLRYTTVSIVFTVAFILQYTNAQQSVECFKGSPTKKCPCKPLTFVSCGDEANPFGDNCVFPVLGPSCSQECATSVTINCSPPNLYRNLRYMSNGKQKNDASPDAAGTFLMCQNGKWNNEEDKDISMIECRSTN